MNVGTLSFDDTRTAFSAKTDNDLLRAYWLFRIIGYKWLVDISPPFVNFALKARLPVKGIIRSTAFKQFCGGETIAECDRTIQKLAEYNIGTILDYSVEGKESEADFENALNETLATIRKAKGNPHMPFCVFKPSAFASLAVLEKVNNGVALSPEEKAEYDQFRRRILTICETASENDVPVFIDAEESWIQEAVDRYAEELMILFNRKKAIVYNTLQMYRTDRLAYLGNVMSHAAKYGYIPGLKIVRGAYLEKENKRAAEKGYVSPIHKTKADTDRDYDGALKICADNVEKVALCAGTHNEASSMLLVKLMNERNIAKNHPHIWFSQLYGMSDHISYNLAKDGYNVCKYVPYGPVEAVLPYLIRRAQENTSVAGQTGRELSLIMKERRRRKMKMEW